ncbi:MAG TPA: selenoneine synthase SenA, partial [Azonexus sp.]|nr:selenoneine synthase SenA [Azonexus sp.]
ASRQRTLALLDAYVEKLGEALVVPYSTQLNPPLWEAGHVAWFQDYWVTRNKQRGHGVRADPEYARPDGRLPQADALYNSSHVPHATRWALPLPSLSATLEYLAASLADTLTLLADTPETDDDLYFFRLALFHEDMHGEAAVYMAQALDITLPATLLAAPQTLPQNAALHIPAQRWTLGHADAGFAFDNELTAHAVDIAPFAIDSTVVTWARYLPFLEATGTAPPRYVRRQGDTWQGYLFGAWRALPLAAPATHLSWFEADAWCRWAGRRLPSEAEWEMAALTQPGFHWGQVWEWTASRFLPYPGFVAHPYRDYSAPWFGERYVLRGASRATSPRMAHPRYRNYFMPERNDIHGGFRSCAL